MGTQAESRLYEVNDGEKSSLVEAMNQSQALRHAAKSRFTVSIPSTKRVAELISGGAKIDKAGEAE